MSGLIFLTRKKFGESTLKIQILEIVLDYLRVFKQKNDKEILDSRIVRFGSIALDIVEPEHHNSTNKCLSCRFSNCCEYRIG